MELESCLKKLETNKSGRKMVNKEIKDELQAFRDNETYKVIKKITKGMSGDNKYYIETNDGRKMLLRIADISEYDRKKREYQFVVQLNKSHIPMPEAISFTISKDKKRVLTLLSWIEGQEVEKIISGFERGKQYELGYQAGKILRKIHNNSEITNPTVDWYDRYYSVLQYRLDAYNAEGVPFEGADRILDYIKNNSYLLHNRIQCRLHGDYHMGNLILDKYDEINVIDWHTVDFEDGGDPWFEFNRVGVEYPEFASGEIDGYFDNNVPDNFWKVFTLYISASAITSIVWAKYFAPEELDNILKLNKNVLEWFDGMEKCIPNWYTKKCY